MRGIARDLSAANIGKLKPLKATKIIGKYDIQKEIKINKDVESNIYASFRLIKNIKNCESPRWLKNRLEAIGLRPINALVDVTNYLTYDLNRPLHVFDYDKINKGLEIQQKLAKRFLHSMTKSITSVDLIQFSQMIIIRSQSQVLLVEKEPAVIWIL